MKTSRQLLIVVAVASVLGVRATSVLGTTISVNGATVFSTGYEGDAATSLPFSDAGNADANDLDPTTTITGSWLNVGTGVWEKPSASGASYTAISKQVQ